MQDWEKKIVASRLALLKLSLLYFILNSVSLFQKVTNLGNVDKLPSNVDSLERHRGFGNLCSLTSNFWMRKLRPERLNDSLEATQPVAELGLKSRPCDS